jgi:hypothetical protein
MKSLRIAIIPLFAAALATASCDQPGGDRPFDPVIASGQTVQQPPPPPTPAHPAPSRSAPGSLNALTEKLRSASFAAREEMAAAFTAANADIDTMLSELRAAATPMSGNAEANLSLAREKASERFRDLTLATEETWATARDNASTALQDLKSALELLHKPAQ